MLPGFLSFCLLNIHSGWWDEVAIVGLVVYLMGPKARMTHTHMHARAHARVHLLFCACVHVCMVA